MSDHITSAITTRGEPADRCDCTSCEHAHALEGVYSEEFRILEEFGGCPEVKCTGGNVYVIEDGAGQRPNSQAWMFLMATNGDHGLADAPAEGEGWTVGLYDLETGENLSLEVAPSLEVAYRAAFDALRP